MLVRMPLHFRAIALFLLLTLCVFAVYVAAQSGGVIVNFNDVHQRIDGFGACDRWHPALTDAQADLFFSPSATRAGKCRPRPRSFHALS